MYSPPATPTPPMVSGLGYRVLGWTPIELGTPASATVDTAISYHTVLVPSTCVVRRVWWANGATTSGGATIQVGVYADADFMPSARLVYGSATQGTASEVQFVDVTDTTLAPGRYWIGVATSTSTNTTLFRTSSNARYNIVNKVQETGTSLPSTATPVETTSTQIYVCGFATTASP